jgi:hypothetical protein
VVGLEEHELTLGNESMVLSGGRHRNEEIVSTVKDEDRHLQRLQNVSQWSLVGVVEITSIGHIEGEGIEKPEVGDRFVQDPQQRQLESVDGVVQTVAAEELQFLDADRGEQGEGTEALRRESRQLESHPASHAEAHGMDLLDSEMVEKCRDIESVGADRVVGDSSPRVAKAGEIGRQSSEPPHQRWSQGEKISAASGATVEQQYRGLATFFLTDSGIAIGNRDRWSLGERAE